MRLHASLRNAAAITTIDRADRDENDAGNEQAIHRLRRDRHLRERHDTRTSPGRRAAPKQRNPSHRNRETPRAQPGDGARNGCADPGVRGTRRPTGVGRAVRRHPLYARRGERRRTRAAWNGPLSARGPGSYSQGRLHPWLDGGYRRPPSPRGPRRLDQGPSADDPGGIGRTDLGLDRSAPFVSARCRVSSRRTGRRPESRRYAWQPVAKVADPAWPRRG